MIPAATLAGTLAYLAACPVGRPFAGGLALLAATTLTVLGT